MAVDINLNIYKDAARTKHFDCIHLYFGKALSSQWEGWDWAEKNEMRVDLPWALDNKTGERGKVIPKETLVKWVQDGFLSPDPWREDTSGDFLSQYPRSAVLVLSFLDWS